MSDYLDPNNEELLKDFFAEAEQQVEQLESNILVIENDPSNHEAIDEIFRAAHTLKGGSATVEMMELSHFTHSVEDVLDEIRSDRVAVDEDVVDLLLTSIDVIKAMLEARQNGSVYEENIDGIIEKLKSYIPQKGAAAAPKKAPAKPAPVAAPAPSAPAAASVPASGLTLPPLSEDDYMELKSACEGSQALWCVAVKFDENNPMNTVGGIQVFAALKAVGNVLKTVPDFDALYEDQFYENVFYYLASSETGESIEDASFLSDVTLITDAHQLNDDNYAGGADSAQPVQAAPAAAPVSAPVQAAPVQAAPQQAPASTEGQAKAAQINEQIAEKKAEAKPEQKKDAPAAAASGHTQQGSILRVDSRRIDNLLNLVSEAVIIKASFNQLAAQTASELVKFQTIESQFRERFRGLVDAIPGFFDDLQKGVPLNELKKRIGEEYGDMGSMFDQYESETKGITGRFRSYTQQLGTIAGELQEGVMKI
ncbi:MAG: Hpt domain-containing protein, partial [Treponema sp.]|nr:Hpt domain-containing protein [Treponema sp.]